MNFIFSDGLNKFKMSSKSVTNIQQIFQFQRIFERFFSFFSPSVKKAKKRQKKFCHKKQRERTLCHQTPDFERRICHKITILGNKLTICQKASICSI